MATLSERVQSLYTGVSKHIGKLALSSALFLPLLQSCPPAEHSGGGLPGEIPPFTGTLQGDLAYTVDNEIVCYHDGYDWGDYYSLFLLSSDLTEHLLARNSDYYWDDHHILWSPDNLFISYSARNMEDEHCYDGDPTILDTLGNTVYVPPFNTLWGETAWSPDGSTFLFSSYYYGIYAYNVGNSSTTQILTSQSATFDHSPAYSPNGERIAFVHHEYGSNGYVRMMNADGSNITPVALFDTDHDENLQLQWLDDTSFILKVESDGVYDVDVHDLQDITVTPRINQQMYELRLSPDKGMVAYTTPDDDVYAAYTSSWHPFLIVPHSLLGQVHDLTWAPDSSQLALITEDYLYLYDLPQRQLYTVKSLPPTALAFFNRQVEWSH